MTGVEIDMIVADSKKALDLYEKIFEVERLEVTDLEKGRNEAVFTIYGTRFHLLDENEAFEMTAPKPHDPKPVWFNIIVPDIQNTYGKVLAAGCTEVQAVTEIPEMGVSNAMFADPFGYLWLIHQINREVSFEERCRIMEDNIPAGGSIQ